MNYLIVYPTFKSVITVNCTYINKYYHHDKLITGQEYINGKNFSAYPQHFKTISEYCFNNIEISNRDNFKLTSVFHKVIILTKRSKYWENITKGYYNILYNGYISDKVIDNIYKELIEFRERFESSIISFSNNILEKKILNYFQSIPEDNITINNINKQLLTLLASYKAIAYDNSVNFAQSKVI
jgi:hypothetical protein